MDATNHIDRPCDSIAGTRQVHVDCDAESNQQETKNRRKMEEKRNTALKTLIESQQTRNHAEDCKICHFLLEIDDDVERTDET